MNNVMHLANLLATEPQFKADCAVDLNAALTRWGLTLTDLEFRAIKKLYESVEGSLGDIIGSEFDCPSQGWWLSR